MRFRINDLPEEIIHYIYKILFDEILKEIKSTMVCCMCDRIIFSENSINLSYSNCINCNNPVCFECWKTYCNNYGRGWKPYLRHCNHCAIEKINTVGYSEAIYPN